MKKILSILLVLAMLPGLSACDSVYTNYREVEQLLVVQVMGLDYSPRGVMLSLASAADLQRGTAPVRLDITAPTIATAFDQARNYSFEESLFYAHIGDLLIGEQAAKMGMEGFLNYICQSPRLRMDIPVYIVKDGSAKQAVMYTGDESKGVSEILRSVREYWENRGLVLTTAADLMRDSLRHGSALVTVLSYIPSVQQDISAQSSSGSAQGQDSEGGGQQQDNQNSGGQQDGTQSGQNGQDAQDGGQQQDTQGGDPAQQQDGAQNGQSSQDGQGESGGGQSAGDQGTTAHTGSGGGERQTLAADGYAVIKDMKLCAYLDLEQALGVGFLLNRVGTTDIVVADERGSPVTLEISDGSCDIRPLWSGDGTLRRIDVAAKVQATVLETDGRGSIDDASYADSLTGQLESSVSARISEVLRLSGELGADFLGLGDTVGRSNPRAYAAMGRPFAELLPQLEIRVTVKGQLNHSNDMRQTI